MRQLITIGPDQEHAHTIVADKVEFVGPVGQLQHARFGFVIGLSHEPVTWVFDTEDEARKGRAQFVACLNNL